ncbi:MAG: DUF1036 domain-containing protein [Rhizomicrobium sp.]
MNVSARFFCAAICVAAALAATPASAALTVCNQTSYVIDAAIGYQAKTEAITQGWARIIPGKCANIFPAPLTSAAYYLYARSSQVHSGPAREWGGKVRLCAKTADFVVHQPLIMDTCPDDSFIMPFSRIETHGKANWTMTLTEQPAITSFDLARQAGIVRLLIDSGYKITDAKSASGALASFYKRMKLNPGVSVADLFDALQTAARKSAAPTGYSICNDGATEIYAAIGMQDGGALLSRGWWKVTPGSCARALTKPLSYDKVYLLVESHTNPKLVSGPEKFCVADIEYETPQRTDCAAKGLSEAGFAVTATRGLTGYAAHIGNSGLLPQPAQMPK